MDTNKAQLPAAVQESLDKIIKETLEYHYNLKGDDCKKSRSFLIGWMDSEFRHVWGRFMVNPEETYAMAKINEFLTAAVGWVIERYSKSREGLGDRIVYASFEEAWEEAERLYGVKYEPVVTKLDPDRICVCMVDEEPFSMPDDGCAGCLTASKEHPCLGHHCTAWCGIHVAHYLSQEFQDKAFPEKKGD